MKMKKKQGAMNKKSEESLEEEIDSALALKSTVRYSECQKNHAASLGGYAVDGCREFMASGEEGTDLALVCAACGCHRNFHRREVDAEVVYECSPTVSCSSNQYIS